MIESNQGKQATLGSCNLIINVVLAYYFCQYAYNNPDEGSCWAISRNSTPSAIPIEGYKNVTEQFVTWFFWGFWINIA